jgi:exodeoxyribonuclease X
MIVIDTETTGMSPDDQVIEWAGVWPGGQACFLIKPTVLINVEARAAHHITDRMLDNVANAKTWRPTLEKHLSEHGTPVFHNAEFDVRMIKQTWPGIVIASYICTYRVALHLWPDAPRHSNQVLRYWLGLEPKIKTNLPPHRALADAAVTAAILDKMMETVDEERMLELTTMSAVLHRVRFGKHVDWLWSDVPHDYLRWILRNGEFDHDVIYTAKHYLENRR